MNPSPAVMEKELAAATNGTQSSGSSQPNTSTPLHSRMFGYGSAQRADLSVASASSASSSEPGEPLSSLFFHTVHSQATTGPPSRWAHSASFVVSDRNGAPSPSMIIFGGIGHTQVRCHKPHASSSHCWQLTTSHSARRLLGADLAGNTKSGYTKSGYTKSGYTKSIVWYESCPHDC